MGRMRFTITFLIFALSISSFYAERSHAAILNPFSSTFDCPEQAQGTLGWVNCDGLSKGGDQTTNAGSKEAITIDANFPDGSGGRGQRHWIGPGTNNNSGELNRRFLINQTEIYIRYYFRYEAGYTASGGHKMLYFSQGQDVYFLLPRPSGDRLQIVISGQSYQDTNSPIFNWVVLNGGSTSSDGKWHCTEIHIKLDSPAGSGNGVAEWWFDGVRYMRLTNLNFRNPDGLFEFGAPANTSSASSSDKYNDTDDWEIRTTGPIGCTYGIPGKPSAPKNLQVN